MSPAACLPTSLKPPDRPQYRFQPHVAGKQHSEKRRLKLDEPEAETSHTTKNSYFLKGTSHVHDEARTVSSQPTSDEAAVDAGPTAASAAPLLLVTKSFCAVCWP